jgi:hypothetical protein
VNTYLDFSVGAISQAHGKVAAALKAPVAEAAASLSGASVLHMDETRYPREGSSNWVWGAIQPKLAVFSILPSRARYVALDLIGAYVFSLPPRGTKAFGRLLRQRHRVSGAVHQPEGASCGGSRLGCGALSIQAMTA